MIPSPLAIRHRRAGLVEGERRQGRRRRLKRRWATQDLCKTASAGRRRGLKPTQQFTTSYISLTSSGPRGHLIIVLIVCPWNLFRFDAFFNAYSWALIEPQCRQEAEANSIENMYILAGTAMHYQCTARLVSSMRCDDCFS